MNSKHFILCDYRHTRRSDLNFEIRCSRRHILYLRKKMYRKMRQSVLTVIAFSKFCKQSQKSSKSILEFAKNFLALTTWFSC